MMQPPPWGELQDFLAIARSGQLARAAAAAGVDATTMGRRLRRLETRLGQRLFEQTREGQTLTEAGERLLVQVEQMQAAAEAIVDTGAGSGSLAGLLRVSMSEAFGAWLIADHLRTFASAHPHLTIDLVASSGFLSPSRREADVAVLLARPAHGSVVARKLADYTLHLYAGTGYVAARGRPSRATLGRDHPLVGYIPDLLYAPELRYLQEIDPGLAPQVRSSSILAQARLIASGCGVGVLPHFVGSTDPQLVRVVDDITIRRAFWLVTHRDTRQLRRVQLFGAWLHDLVTRHAPRLCAD